MAEMGIALVLTLVGLWFGISAWGQYWFYSNFRSALMAHAAGRLQDALPSLSNISLQRPEYPYPDQLYAKLKVDGGEPKPLSEAVELYGRLRYSGIGDLSILHLGLAAAHLKLSDLADSKTERQKELE